MPLPFVAKIIYTLKNHTLRWPTIQKFIWITISDFTSVYPSVLLSGWSLKKGHDRHNWWVNAQIFIIWHFKLDNGIIFKVRWTTKKHSDFSSFEIFKAQFVISKKIMVHQIFLNIAKLSIFKSTQKYKKAKVTNPTIERFL